MMTEKFMNPTIVAETLGVSRNTVIRLILARQLGATMIGKQYRVSDSQLAEYVRRYTIQPAEKPQ